MSWHSATRRSFLVQAAALAAAARASEPSRRNERPYLAAALKAARWIEASRQQTDSGIAWPVDPSRPAVVSANLYSGFPGVMLFLVELDRATGRRTFREAAIGSARELVARLDDSRSPEAAGFYTGLAGAGFVLDEVARLADDSAIRGGAERCFERVRGLAMKADAGTHWNGVTDVISGSAGIGLYLLDYARRHSNARSLELATEAGAWLIAQGQRSDGGLRWPMSATQSRRMPNFSHGTAGIAFFLASLYEATHDRRFLDAALEGALYLDAVAQKTEQGWRVFHHEPGGEELFYLGWCHGPAGTGRLFESLARITRDDRWRRTVGQCARAVRTSGIPERRTPGFWNNVGTCCGSAGVAQFFLDRYRATNQSDDLEFCRRMADDVLRRATAAGDGLKWDHAENRVAPNALTAQTGLMQGAAGIGLFLLRLDGFFEKRPDFVRLPDELHER